MLSSKEKRQLKALSNHLPYSAMLGKKEIEDGVLKTIDDALNAHELVKIRILETHDRSIKEEGELLSTSLNAEVIQILGRVITLYRYSPKKKEHLLS